ncbi:hypothetical protein INR49_014797%2C partial [Scomber scombrus]|uniref:Uncharacterized protein n=1 Tax=Scomber scombrus TaxID=13677 RepID=A0AAV1NR23_SCOSC
MGGFGRTHCIAEGNVVSERPLKFSNISLCVDYMRVCVRCIFKHLSGLRSAKLENQPGTDHAEVTAPERDGPPLALFGDRSHSWCRSTGIHTPMIIHSGVIVLHISPPAPAVRHGHSWSHMGDSGLLQC